MHDIKPLYDAGAEQSVLGSMLLKNSLIAVVERKVKAKDFYSIAHKKIYDGILQAFHEHGNADLVTVESVVGEDADMFGGFAYLADVVNNTPSTANVNAYIDIVLQLSHKRRIIDLTNAIAEMTRQGEDPSELAAELAGMKVGKSVRPLFSLEMAMEKMESMVFYEPAPVDGVFVECLPMGEPGILTAPGGVGKSFTTISMAISIATGKPVFEGRQSWLTPMQKGKCIILAGEDGIGDYHRRLHGIMKDKNLSEDQKREVMSNVLIVSLRGQDIRIIAEEKGSAKRTEFVDRFVETLMAYGDTRLVIIDPMIRFYGAGENDNHTATLFINEINRLCEALPGNPATLLVHHSSKAEKGGARGASAFVDGCRTQLSMITLEMKKAGDKKAIIEDGDKDKIVFEMKKSNHFKYWDEQVLLKRGEHGTLERMDLSEGNIEAREMERIKEREHKALVLEMLGTRNGMSQREIEAHRTVMSWGGQAPSRDKLRNMLRDMIDSGMIIEGDNKKLFAKGQVRSQDMDF